MKNQCNSPGFPGNFSKNCESLPKTAGIPQEFPDSAPQAGPGGGPREKGPASFQNPAKAGETGLADGKRDKKRLREKGPFPAISPTKNSPAPRSNLKYCQNRQQSLTFRTRYYIYASTNGK
jgi:hypothetical protein